MSGVGVGRVSIGNESYILIPKKVFLEESKRKRALRINGAGKAKSNRREEPGSVGRDWAGGAHEGALFAFGTPDAALWSAVDGWPWLR